MLRKKQISTQMNNLIKLKETSRQLLQKRNDKVTVQYIQEQQQLIQKPGNGFTNNTDHSAAQEDLEIENVEYLEEQPTTEELITGTATESGEFEDTFYPNAIHCLLDLYKDKYDNLVSVNEERGELNVAQVWQDIAKDMQESYFEFNESQVRQKYILLKEQYFCLYSKEAIENFDYFEQLHNIYKDPAKENLLMGLGANETATTYYKDEFLLNPEPAETNNEQIHDFKSEEIVHKEHELIDMVEKELQAIEDGIQDEESNKNENNMHDKHNSQQTIEIVHETSIKLEDLAETQTNLKRHKSNDEESPREEPPAKRKQTFDESGENTMIPHTSSAEPILGANKDFTLGQYNENQERRHREKMLLLERSLKLQEIAMEQQRILLQELIKRLPS